MFPSFTVSPPKNTLNITIIAALLKVMPASLEVSLKAEATPKSPRGIRLSPQLRMAGMKKAVPAPMKSKAITVWTIEVFSPMPTTRSRPKKFNRHPMAATIGLDHLSLNLPLTGPRTIIKDLGDDEDEASISRIQIGDVLEVEGEGERDGKGPPLEQDVRQHGQTQSGIA